MNQYLVVPKCLKFVVRIYTIIEYLKKSTREYMCLETVSYTFHTLVSEIKYIIYISSLF